MCIRDRNQELDRVSCKQVFPSCGSALGIWWSAIPPLPGVRLLGCTKPHRHTFCDIAPAWVSWLEMTSNLSPGQIPQPLGFLDAKRVFEVVFDGQPRQMQAGRRILGWTKVTKTSSFFALRERTREPSAGEHGGGCGVFPQRDGAGCCLRCACGLNPHRNTRTNIELGGLPFFHNRLGFLA